MSNNKSFFIKPGYIINPKALSYDEPDREEYWAKWRLAQTHSMQYYVYKKAWNYAKKYQYKKLLDVGSGPAEKLRNFFGSADFDITLLDQPSVEELALSSLPGARFVSTNLEEIQKDFISDEFDLIICADVIEHLSDPTNCIEFIKDRIRPGGIVVFSTVERDFLRGKECNECLKPHHVREWNSQEFRELITSFGFHVDEQQAFPQLKLGQIEFLLSRALPRQLVQWNSSLARKWLSCQVLICKKQ